MKAIPTVQKSLSFIAAIFLVANHAALAASSSLPRSTPEAQGVSTKDWDQGYGFQFWRCRHGAFRADGANGQFCIVLPEQDAVIAITADTRDMQAQLNVVWDKLLPALHAKRLPSNKPEHAKLKETLASLAVRPAAPSARSGL